MAEAGGFLVQRKAAATRRRKAASKQQTADDDDNDHDAGKTDGQDAEKQNGEHIEAGIEEGSAQQPMDVEAGEEPQAGLGDEAAQRAAQSLGSQASEAGGDDARPGTVPTPQERDKDPLEELFEEEEQVSLNVIHGSILEVRHLWATMATGVTLVSGSKLWDVEP